MKKIVSVLFCVCTFAVLAAENMMPLIGISGIEADARSCVRKTYVNAVRRAGGCPVVLPITDDDGQITALLKKLDGVILTGGEDIDPSRYGERPHPKLGSLAPARDEFDFKLARATVKAGKPILGICRGHQMLCVAFGGTLYQDIPSQIPQSTLKHNQGDFPRDKAIHEIALAEGGILSKLFDTRKIAVNSFHHQAVKKCPEGFRIIALGEDGVVEAMERVSPLQKYSDGGAPILGVQFHPEEFISAGNTHFLPIFAYLVTCAQRASLGCR